MEVSQEELLNPFRNNYSFLLIGAPKEGKTQSVDTFHDWLVESKAISQSVYMYDFDNGAESLIRKAREKGWIRQLRVFRYSRKGGEKIIGTAEPTRSIDEFNDFLKEFNTLYDLVDHRTNKWKDPTTAPGLVVIDSISAIRRIITDFILKMRGKEITGEKGSGVTFTEQDLFKLKMMAVIDAAQGLPCHSIFTAHVEIRQEMSRSGAIGADPTPTGNSYVVPIIFGDLRWNLTSLFDGVLYTKPNWQWQTKPDARIKGAGVRTTENLPIVIPQDFRLILKAVNLKPLPADTKSGINGQAIPVAIEKPLGDTSIV